MYSVYKITNIINGKSYIGLSENPNGRFLAHLSNSNSIHLKKAVKKYGKSNFSLSILKTNIISKDEGKIIEDRYMYQYGSIYPNGFNYSCNRALISKKSREFGEKVRPIFRVIKTNLKNISEATCIPLNRLRLIFGYSHHFPSYEEQKLISEFLKIDFVPIYLLD